MFLYTRMYAVLVHIYIENYFLTTTTTTKNALVK